ncbi:hypothetical protein CDL15_Pgr004666 [Punica granatum]|uniref:Uncharacterized protein n=1 Tax=Punica granatum TaxID=22663 RepID=A0A218WQ04_PUNGR|nr:hypothetical protein CDL15_Pgr004666 [Punica granatum]
MYLQNRLIHFAQEMAVESAQEWLHHWLLELWHDDSLEKIQNDIQDGETDSMDRIFTAYIHKICALIDHPVSHVNMDLPWFDQSSSSRNKTHKHQDLPLPPKKRFCIKSSLTAWRPDSRQQLILDDIWSSIKNPQKGEVSINALVLHMEEQSNSKASLQQELCQKIDSLQKELSLQKAQTHAFLQNRLVEFDNFTEHFAEMQRENHALKKKDSCFPPEQVS